VPASTAVAVITVRSPRQIGLADSIIVTTGGSLAVTEYESVLEVIRFGEKHKLTAGCPAKETSHVMLCAPGVTNPYQNAPGLGELK